ncbi:MAG: hypothetical protein PHE17_14140 [Thiothrix sp.]|uniref:hypothetical protein n=1 Tax=Thiothrix sp. TaxID=1032 RepID=UPI00262A4BB6|nr:hypothetical protein [Thiothrix sp.]MDD5394149.1 hypothetical protein [Thiothrix sp.]
MDTKETYKNKVEAELELAQAKLAEFQARSKSAMADAHIAYNEQASELEKMFDNTKVKLKELSEASDGAWEQLKDGVENAWNTLSTAVRDTTNKFKD